MATNKQQTSPDQKKVDGQWYWLYSYDYCKALESKIKRLEHSVKLLQDETTLLKLITQERDELQAVVREIDEGDNSDLWGSLVAQRDALQATIIQLQAKMGKTHPCVYHHRRGNKTYCTLQSRNVFGHIHCDWDTQEANSANCFYFRGKNVKK